MATPQTEARIGRVLIVHGGFYDVETQQGMVRCRLPGRFKKSKRFSKNVCVAGDNVEVFQETVGVDTVWKISKILDRSSYLARSFPRESGKRGEDIMSANVDIAFVVLAYQRPDFSSRLLDRFLMMTSIGNVQTVIVCNKIDKRDEMVDEQLRVYEGIGYRVIRSSIFETSSIDEIRTLCENNTVTFIGPSGVGKSSIINEIDPAVASSIGEVNKSTGKGKHTTRTAQLYRFRSGFLMDTPGIKELGLPVIESVDVQLQFHEFLNIRENCAFRDCIHRNEPRCAIKSAVTEGSIQDFRYQSYLTLLLEAEEKEQESLY